MIRSPIDADVPRPARGFVAERRHAGARDQFLQARRQLVCVLAIRGGSGRQREQPIEIHAPGLVGEVAEDGQGELDLEVVIGGVGDDCHADPQRR